MITGAVMGNNAKPLSISSIYKKNIRRFALAFVFWSAVYVLHGCLLTYLKNGSVERSFSDLFWEFLRGHYHMWFLYMIIGLYIVLPLLRKIAESEKLTFYFLMVALVFSVVLPAVCSIPGLSELETVYHKMSFHLVLGYSGYFMLGCYLSQKQISGKAEGIFYGLGILGFLFTAGISAAMSAHQNQPIGYYSNFSVNVLLETMAVYVFAKKRIGKISFGKGMEKGILRLSGSMFGVYLIHALIMETLNYWGFNSLSFSPVLSVPVLSMTVFLISLVIVLLMERIPLLRRVVL